MSIHFHPNGPVKAWYASGTATAFMVPQCEYFDTAEANEFVGMQADDDTDAEPGWYARLTAPGYLDCTDWRGPYPSAFRAVRDLCRTFDVDLDGQPIA